AGLRDPLGGRHPQPPHDRRPGGVGRRPGRDPPPEHRVFEAVGPQPDAAAVLGPAGRLAQQQARVRVGGGEAPAAEPPPHPGPNGAPPPSRARPWGAAPSAPAPPHARSGPERAPAARSLPSGRNASERSSAAFGCNIRIRNRPATSRYQSTTVLSELADARV